MTLAPATGARAETPAYAGARTTRVPVRATCNGTRVDGEPCCSVVVRPDGFCRLHSPTLAVDRVENARTAGRRSGEVRRERGMTVKQLVHERLEADADLIYRELQEAISRGDRLAAGEIVDRAMNVSKPQAKHLDELQSMRARRERARSHKALAGAAEELYVEL